MWSYTIFWCFDTDEILAYYFFSNIKLVNDGLATCCLDHCSLLNLLQIVKYQEKVDQLVFCTHHLVQNTGKAVMAQTTLNLEMLNILFFFFLRELLFHGCLSVLSCGSSNMEQLWITVWEACAMNPAMCNQNSYLLRENEKEE